MPWTQFWLVLAVLVVIAACLVFIAGELNAIKWLVFKNLKGEDAYVNAAMRKDSRRKDA
jgi:hypothetical protein